jgi:hypothetical protein
MMTTALRVAAFFKQLGKWPEAERQSNQGTIDN